MDAISLMDPLKKNIEEIQERVAAIEEMYQPIYGYPDLSLEACRSCEDRLEHIVAVYGAMERKLGRSLRVLDLGCAQGYFSLSLANLGAEVTGVDINPNNIALCQALAKNYPHAKLNFMAGLNEKFISEMPVGSFDLVLGLSVFHHTVHRTGFEFVQKIFALLAQKTLGGIFEIALADEPLYWAEKQPKNPRDFFVGYAFLHELARNSSHLSPMKRPLFVASNSFWFLREDVEFFQSWKAESHPYAGDSTRGTRRYYFSTDKVAKVFIWSNDDLKQINQSEHVREVDFLSHISSDYGAPRLFLHGMHDQEAWLVREKVPGDLLIDKVIAKEVYDALSIVHDLLRQLSILEKHDLYHNDLRVSNVLIDEKGRATIIDYGAISHEKRDGSWPYNLFFSFMILVHDLVKGEVAASNVFRTVALNPENFPEPYRSSFWKLYGISPDQWNFAILYENFLKPDAQAIMVSQATRESFAAVVNTVEAAAKIHVQLAVFAKQRINQLEQMLREKKST